MSKTQFAKYLKIQNEINEFGIKCVSILNSKIKNDQKKGEINLIELFFHDLVCFFTSAQIVNITKVTSDKTPTLPYVNSKFILNPSDFKIPTIRKKSTSLIDLLLKLNFWSSKTLWIGFGLTKEVKKTIFFKLFRYKIKKIKFDYLKVNYSDYQHFMSEVVEISNKLNINFNKSHFNAIDNYFKSLIKFNPSSEKFDYKNQILITGTNCKIAQRIMSAKFLKNQGRVISFGHGDCSIDVFDEPIFDYGEIKFNSIFADFGRLSLVGKRSYKSVIKIHSKVVQKLHDKNHKTKSKKLLYVPTSLSSYRCYAPYRNFFDEFYIEWQLIMIKTLAKNNINVMVKTHPKSLIEYSHISGDLIELKNLEECFDIYDGFIFDYASTALTKTLSIDKKIIYFDLGNRKISNNANNCLKLDVAYKKIDFNLDLDKQISEPFSFNNKRQYNFIEQYSLGGHSIESIIENFICNDK